MMWRELIVMYPDEERLWDSLEARQKNAGIQDEAPVWEEMEKKFPFHRRVLTGLAQAYKGSGDSSLEREVWQKFSNIHYCENLWDDGFWDSAHLAHTLR